MKPENQFGPEPNDPRYRPLAPTVDGCLRTFAILGVIIIVIAAVAIGTWLNP